MSSISQNIYNGVDGSLKAIPTKVSVLEPFDVLIKITHSSVCGTDLVYVPYGIALGHEGIDIVKEVGNTVTQLKIGDRVGAGYHRKLLRVLQVLLKGTRCLVLREKYVW
jgi:D-arabinose 1-dehydrogenase-like Zn-dependent alcohol dehydrogenase